MGKRLRYGLEDDGSEDAGNEDLQRSRNRLKPLLSIPSNSVCADCGGPGNEHAFHAFYSSTQKKKKLPQNRYGRPSILGSSSALLARVSIGA